MRLGWRLGIPGLVVAAIAGTAVAVVRPERSPETLAQAQAFRARPVQRGDRRQRGRAGRRAGAAAEIGDEEAQLVDQPADLAPELEFELDVVGLAVPVVVDVEGIADVGIESEVVRARARLAAWKNVHDQDDPVILAGFVAAEHEEVGDVGGRVERDERRLAVAGRQRGRRNGRERKDRQSEERAAKGLGQNGCRAGPFRFHGYLLVGRE